MSSPVGVTLCLASEHVRLPRLWPASGGWRTIVGLVDWFVRILLVVDVLEVQVPENYDHFCVHDEVQCQRSMRGLRSPNRCTHSEELVLRRNDDAFVVFSANLTMSPSVVSNSAYCGEVGEDRASGRSKGRFRMALEPKPSGGSRLFVKYSV